MSPLVLALLIVHATVYSWTDKNGVEHFTDDLASIPKGVKVRTTEGAEISLVESDTVRNPRPPSVVPSQPAAPSVSEQTWRQLFKNAHTRIAELEIEIEADRTKVEEVNGLPVRPGFTCVPGFVQQPSQPFPGPIVGPPMTGTTLFQPQVAFTGAPCFYSYTWEFEQMRQRLAKNRRELVRAREDLADLERRASFEAVPLHWRR